MDLGWPQRESSPGQGTHILGRAVVFREGEIQQRPGAGWDTTGRCCQELGGDEGRSGDLKFTPQLFPLVIHITSAFPSVEWGGHLCLPRGVAVRAEIIHSSTVLAHSGACWLFPSAFLWCGLFLCSDHRVSSGGDSCPPVEAPTWLSSFSSTEFFICENS